MRQEGRKRPGKALDFLSRPPCIPSRDVRRTENQRQAPSSFLAGAARLLGRLTQLVTALDVLYVSMARTAFLFFVWEIKLLMGKVSGPAACHCELDESGWAWELLGIYHRGTRSR